MKLGSTTLLLTGAALVGYWVYKKGAAVAEAVNPLNPDNVFATGANDLTQTVTGNPNTSLGTAAYDVTHAWLTFPDGSTKEYFLASPVTALIYGYERSYGGGVPSDALGNPL